jgi:hypothetical protein
LLIVEEPLFDHHIPLVDEHNRLLLNHDMSRANLILSKFICIPDGDNASLAWEFVARYVLSAMYDSNINFYTSRDGRTYMVPMGISTLDSPISIAFQEYKFMNGVLQALTRTWGPNQAFLGINHNDLTFSEGFTEGLFGYWTDNAAVHAAMHRLYEFNSMPISPHNYFPLFLYERYIYDLLYGELTPEEAANQIETALREWMGG